MNATNDSAILNNATSIAATTGDSNALVVAQGTLVAFGTVIFTLSFIGSILCAILIAAMTLPLASPKGRAAYSTYNLYLAFLSIPDMFANVFITYAMFVYTPWVGHDNNDPDISLWFDDNPYDDAIYQMCMTANLYTNAFLTFEIYKLLKYSSHRKRYYPPTIGKVTKQAMIAFAVGVFVFLVDFVLVADRIDSNTMGLSPQMLQRLDWLHFGFTWIVCVMIPIFILIFVTAMIYCQGLITSTKSLYEGRLRTLSFFFLRIVFIESMVWIPSSVSFSIYWITDDDRTKIISYHISILFSGIQVIVNFICALTKPDTKKLIMDLPHKLCCDCRQEYNSNSNSDDDDDDETNNNNNGPPKRLFRDPFLRIRRSSLSSSFFRFSKRSQSIKSNTIRDEEHGCVDESSRRGDETDTTTTNTIIHESINQHEVDAMKEDCGDARCNDGDESDGTNVVGPTIDNISTQSPDTII